MARKADRQKALEDVLRHRDQVSTAEAMDMFGVSEATVRRMFHDMEKKGVGIRCYGALKRYKSVHGYSFEAAAQAYSREKQRIGHCAAELVEDGDTLFLDCGTTTLQMSIALSEQIASGRYNSLTIITNSIATLEAISPSRDCSIVLTGGEYSTARRDFSGVLTEQFLSPLHFDKCFIGCDGFSLKGGIATRDFSTSSLARCVIARSDSVYVLCDSSKFERSALASICSVGSIHCLVTDAMPRDALGAALRSKAVSVIVAGEAAAPERSAFAASTSDAKRS